ncbi:hypothetical protein Tco_1031831 [Tanacetum coccineum]|uniref:DUF4219 domain-containing protein/UBN2 domain-containing protein n=1 Tax=Tanacetum coccineum TaxID=301880 RepID=A0ABQ5GA35_9ASTR
MDLDSPDDKPIIVSDENEEEEEAYKYKDTHEEIKDSSVPHPPSPKIVQLREQTNQVMLPQSHNQKLEQQKTKAKAKVALLIAQPSYLNVDQLSYLLVNSIKPELSKLLSTYDFNNFIPSKLKDLSSKITVLSREVQELKKHVQGIDIELLGDLKEISNKLETFTSTLKTLDVLPSLLNNVIDTLNMFTHIMENASPKTRDKGVPSAGQADVVKANLKQQPTTTTPPSTSSFQSPFFPSPPRSTSQTEGELIKKDKGKEAMSSKDAEEEETQSDYANPADSIVESSKKKNLDRSMDSDKYLEGQSMQRPPLFESDSFIYWKNRFETYVKSKDLDLWHVITNDDFQPIQQTLETKLDEVIPFEKQSDDLKKRLAKNNEAKMVIYNALPRKEYKRIFMCNTAKEIWKTLFITHQGNNQVKDNKINLLVQQYEQFVISEDESINSDFARFNTIITNLKALDEGYSSKNYVRKFLRALHPKRRSKVTAFEELKDLTSLSFDELIGNLKVHEMIIKKDSEIVKAKVERKSLALKAKRESSDEECSTSRSEDEEYAMAGRNFKKFFKRRSRTRTKEHSSKVLRCDSGEEDDEKAKDEMCLMAQASNELCFDSSYFSDEL